MSTIAKLPTWWKQFIQNVCELDGRDSPEDEPDAMIATDAELQDAALRAIECELEAAPAADAVPVDSFRVLGPKGDLVGLFESSAIANMMASKTKAEAGSSSVIPLVRQSDHLSAIAALQAQVAELQSTLATSCDEERSQRWEAGPSGGGCARALAAEARIAELLQASDTETLCRQQERDNWLRAEAQYQARIAELEARQVPLWFLAECDGDDDAWSDAQDAYEKAAGCLRGHLEWRDRVRAAVISLLSAPSNPTTQPPEGR